LGDPIGIVILRRWRKISERGRWRSQVRALR